MKTIYFKYKTIILPLLAVLVLDLSLLLLNYFFTSQFENDANNINISGRQRMLSQKITKATYFLLFNNSQGIDTSEPINELRSAADLFDRTLSSFLVGGKTISAEGSVVYIPKLKSLETRKILDDATSLWNPVYEAISLLIDHKHHSYPEIESIVMILKENNLRLLDLINDLTETLEYEATLRTKIIRGIQTVTVMLIVFLFSLASLRLYQREKYYSQLTGKSSDIIMGVSPHTGKIKFISASVYELLGYKDKEMLGNPAINIFEKEARSKFSKILESAHKRGCLENECVETQLIRKDKTILNAEMLMNISFSEDEKSIELYLDIRDITERKKLEYKIQHMVHHDELTGLPNRYLLNDRLSAAMIMSRRHKSGLSILFIDIDEFKPVNDNYGHQAGDFILKQVSDRLSKCIRESDTASRYGGDEFIVLLQEVDENNTMLITEKISDAIAAPFEVEGETISISCSIGVAVYSGNHETPDELIKRADKGMYSAKQSGRSIEQC